MSVATLSAAASLKLTLVILVLLGLGVIWAYHSEVRTTLALVLPLMLLAMNLLAAIATRPVFRRQLPLLMFHLALLAILVLIAVGRLTYLKGWVELTEGEEFGGTLTGVEAGPLHAGQLARVRFVNEGFSIDYAPGIQRGATVNRVRWWDEAGREHSGLIGDQTPLVLRGYRFYTSFNKGFAPLFEWAPIGRAPTAGSVHLPSYPSNEYRQAQEWTPPGSDSAIWIMLQFDEVILDPRQPSRYRLPADYALVVREGEQRFVLRPGDYAVLPRGELRFIGLRSWMGYTVFYDWTVPWLLATCLAGLASLGWHYWVKFAKRPWLGDEDALLEAGGGGYSVMRATGRR